MPLLPIKTFPAPVLEKQARPVTKFDSKLKALVDDMVETMLDAPGAGLAAPQVGVRKRLFVMNTEYLDQPEGGKVMINPEILEMEGSVLAEEGCLSLPGVYGDVQRAKRIVVRYQDVSGETHEEEYVDWPARIIQHESDHLNGVLFPERMKGLKKRKVIKKLRRFVEDES